MLKIYLDWNVITHLKDETNTELYSYIMENKDKFIFPYSAAHLKDLSISKSDDNEYYEQDLHLLSEICEHHLLEHEQNINNPYPYKCYPEEYIDKKGQDIKIFNSGFSKDSFFKNLESKGLDPKNFMSLLEKKEIEPLEMPFINRTICNYADIFSVLFEYGPQIFNSKELPKLIQKSIQGATDKDVYKDIQGAKSGNIFRKLDEITIPQIGESFSGMIETVLAERSQSNLDLFTTLYIALNMSGFFADKKRNLQNIYTDSEHAYYASSCDIFVSDDKRLREKTSAIYSEKGIRTFVVSTSELISLMNEELSKSYDIEFMFNTALKTYGVPIREEGEKKVYGQLPFHFLGLFNFCIKLNLPKVDLTIGEFRCNVPQRGYVFYTELERFFNLVLKVINNKEQRSLFQQEFVSKFLTTNKDIVNTATFTIDCPGYLIQLAADKWSHLPLPILFITKKAETGMDSQETINVSGDAPSNVAPPKKKKKKKEEKEEAEDFAVTTRFTAVHHST